MPRTALTPIETPGASPLSAGAMAFTPADPTNGNKFVSTGKELLVVHNTGAGSRNVTFQTIAINGRQDPNHNTAIAVAAGLYKVFGPFPLKGYRQSDGTISVTGSHAEVEFAVLKVD